MALRVQRYRQGVQAPVAFPAWRIWEDRRVRADDAASALLFGVRIARVALHERVRNNPDVQTVADLYSDDELPFRQSFRVSAQAANQRWTSGEQELSTLSILNSVAALDDLLSGTIDLLRVLRHDGTAPGSVDTGVSAKLRHLIRQGGLEVESGSVRLHDLCLAIRHAVVHDGRRQRRVIAAWDRLRRGERDWWTRAAGRPFPLDGSSDELLIDDREMVAAFKAFDAIALQVNRRLSQAVSHREWALIVGRELWEARPHRAGDPTNNVEAVRGWGIRFWRIKLDKDEIVIALRRGDLRGDSGLTSLLRSPLPG